MVKIKGYTDDEIQYIIENYLNYTNQEIADTLGKKSSSISYVAQKLGLIKQPHKPWSEKEDIYLKDNYLILNSEEMAKTLGRTVPSINARCEELNLIKHEVWSDEEIGYLLEHYIDMEYSEIGTHLCRSEGAVRAKCFDLGLYKKELPWTDKEISFVKDNYKEMTISEIAEILNRSPNAIRLKANRMGFKKSPYHCDYHYFDKIDTEEKAYWLGFIAADGWVNKNERACSGAVGIELQYGDINHLKKFNKCINGNYKITDRWRECTISTIPGKTAHSCTIRIFSLIMYEALEKYGLAGNKTYNMKMPQLREDLYRHFLRGYFDGDGRFGLSNNRIWVSFITASKSFNDDLIHFISSLDIGINEFSYTNDYGTTMYSPEISKIADKLLFLDYIYKDSNIYLDRKYKKYLKAKEKYGSSDGLAAQK